MEKTEVVPTPPKMPLSNKIKDENLKKLNYFKQSDSSTENYLNLQEEIKLKAEIFNKDKKIKVFKGKNYKKDNKDSSPPKIKICSFCNKEIESNIFKFHEESHPSKILDWLYLGSYNNATNKKELEYVNVKYIMNCAQECKNLFEKDFTYKHFKLSDTPAEKIHELFDEGYQFIEQARQNNFAIFVHCQIGKSRSATFIIAYLMKHMNMSLEVAYKKVKSSRSMVFPNLGFMRQLKDYELNLGTNSRD